MLSMLFELWFKKVLRCVLEKFFKSSKTLFCLLRKLVKMQFLKNLLLNIFLVFLGKWSKLLFYSVGHQVHVSNSYFWLFYDFLKVSTCWLIFSSLETSAFLPSIVLNLFVHPYKRGFFCDDETIRKPKLDHEQISVYLLAFLVIFFPVVFVCFKIDLYFAISN